MVEHAGPMLGQTANTKQTILYFWTFFVLSYNALPGRFFFLGGGLIVLLLIYCSFQFVLPWNFWVCNYMCLLLILYMLLVFFLWLYYYYYYYYYYYSVCLL